MKWPLLRAVLLYVTGVLIGRVVDVAPFLLLSCSLALVVLAAGLIIWNPHGGAPTPDQGVAAFASKGSGDRLGKARAVLLPLVMLAMGWTNYTVQTATFSPHDLRRIVGPEPRLATVRGVLIETPCLRVYEWGEQPAWRTLARIEVSSVRFERSEWQPAAGRVAVTTPGMLTNWFGGEAVEVFGVLAFPKGPITEGTFDYRAFLAEQRIYYRLQAETAEDWAIVGRPKVAPLADRFRTWARQALGRGLPGEDESLQLEWALTLGWKTALDEGSSQPFIQAATYHIFAVDGLRMAIVFGILFGLLRAVSVPRAICGVALLPVLWFYVALTGWPASAIRATVMLSVVIVGWALKRPSNLINSLLAAALIILIWDPQQLFQAGFQLSFVVVLYMVLMLPPLIAAVRALFAPDPLLPVALKPRLPGFVKAPTAFCADLTYTSFAAWIGSIPLVAYYFNIVTPVSTPANVVAVPLCALVLVSNLASLLLVSWAGPVAELFNHAGWFLMECIRVTSMWFADWPLAWFYVPAPGLFTISLYYALLFALVTGWLLKRGFRGVRLAVAGLAVAVWCATLAPEWLTPRVTVLPANGGLVIYADAFGKGKDLLVDTGNTNAVQFVTKQTLRAHGVNSVANLALSHGDLKHIGGAQTLAEILPVRQVWASPVRFRSTAYRKLLSRFAEEGRPAQARSRGDRLGSWEVLHPQADDRFSRADDGALVLKANIKGTRILLLNDLGRVGQESLLKRSADLRADLVVAGLPAADEPVRDELLDAMDPRVIIVADSEFPASERARQRTRERLAKRAIRVIYTREVGAVTIEFRKQKWEIRTMNGLRLEGRAER